MQRADVQLLGFNKFAGNDADYGGAIRVRDESTLSIYGSLCGQNNSAGIAGGFAAVFIGPGFTFTFFEPFQANLAHNNLYAIDVGIAGTVSALGSGPWPAGAYNITGPVGSCAAAFAAGNGTSCDACGAATPWADGACSCQVRLKVHFS